MSQKQANGKKKYGKGGECSGRLGENDFWDGFKKERLLLFDCLAASNWPPGHPRSDHHVSNPHRPDYY